MQIQGYHSRDKLWAFSFSSLNKTSLTITYSVYKMMSLPGTGVLTQDPSLGDPGTSD